MAKKRASAKPKGLDADNRVIDLGKYDSYIAAEEKRLAYGHFGRSGMSNKSTLFQRQEMKVASRNLQDMVRQGPEVRTNYGKPIALPAATASDKLSGRTPEFGTRSLLEGMKSFMRGGGLRSGRM